MNKKAFIFTCLIATFLLFTTDNTTAAEKGSIEISQKDMPLTITEPGSYILVSNLNISVRDITAIYIATDNVDIDLNGFTMRGPGKGGGGTGMGINTSINQNIVIRNGTVTEFGNVGIHLPGHYNNRVENVRVSYCNGDGIYAGQCSIVMNCQVAYCGLGIHTEGGSIVINNTLYSNDHRGIFVTGESQVAVAGVTVLGNNCRLNPVGIEVWGQGSHIEGNTVTSNTTGIDLTKGSKNYFARNVLQGNTTSVTGESDDVDGGSIDPALSNIML